MRARRGLGRLRAHRRQVPTIISYLLPVLTKDNEADVTGARAVQKARSDAAEVLRQALELRAVVIVADVRNEQDVVALESEAIVDELLTNRLLVVAAEEVVKKAGLPPALLERCTMLEVHTWGCFMNDARLANNAAKQLITQIKPAPGGVERSHYERISALALSNAQINKDAEKELTALLSKTSILRTLDLSNTQVDGAVLVGALKGNSSLRSLDVRMVPPRQEPHTHPHGAQIPARAVLRAPLKRCTVRACCRCHRCSTRSRASASCCSPPTRPATSRTCAATRSRSSRARRTLCSRSGS